MKPQLLSLRFVVCVWAQAAGAHIDSAPGQLRCGWFENPTPANAWFTDRQGAWLVGVQGGHQAEGDWPVFKPWRWVRTNGSHGYGCACLKLVTDPNTQFVTRIVSSSSRSLATCRRDPALQEPKPDWTDRLLKRG
jgi:hypothetical protein